MAAGEVTGVGGEATRSGRGDEPGLCLPCRPLKDAGFTTVCVTSTGGSEWRRDRALSVVYTDPRAKGKGSRT